jgi:3-isopropylmalate/(R)-2-methylmalate dehydratase large subunit
MGMTMIEKILARAAGRDHVDVGEFVVCEVDMTVLIDLQFATLWASPTRIADPERLAVIMDHAVPAPSIADADGGVRAREFVKQYGIERFFDVGRHGICHQVIAENGLARPGEILTCTDSHTCAGGAYNNAARGLGPVEVYSIMCTGKTWFQIAPTLRYELVGEKPTVVTGKDIFLHIAGTYGDATNRNLEFGGLGLASVPMNDRRTIATQGAEISADFTTFPVDDLCREFLQARSDCPLESVDSDPDAGYAAVREVDLSSLEPYVARPGGVADNAIPISLVEQRPVNQCFIGSCANGQIEDLRIAADMLRGQKVAPGVRLIVTPASQAVYTEAIKAGYIEAIAESGAIVTNSTCGACFGYHMGVLGAGEVCLTASTRNFKGRMGSPDAEIYMASPYTVAAAAIAGHIIDPRKVAVS